MPDLIRHPMFFWIAQKHHCVSAYAGMTTFWHLPAGVIGCVMLRVIRSYLYIYQRPLILEGGL